MARIESRPPYDASFPQAGSGEFSRIAQEAAKKRSEEKAQEQAQAQERAYAVTEPTPKEEAVEATPIEEPTLKEPIAKPKVKPMPFPRYGFQEDAPWAVNGVTPQKKVEKPSATKKREATNIGADLDPHIVAGHRVSFQEDAPWAKDNPYAFGLEQGFRNQNKFAGKSYEDLDKEAVVTSNSLTMGIIGSDPVIKKELNRRKQRLNDFTLIASTPEALAEYGITLSPETRERIENEIRLGTDSLKDLTPLLQKAKRVKYEEGKEKQRTISQVSDRAYQLEREMERAGATKEADKAMKSDATWAMMLPSPTSAQIWKTTSYNDRLPDTYRAAMQLQEHANELSQLNKSFLSNLEKEKNWAGGVWEGFKNNILTRKAWQDKEGNTYAANEMALYRVIQAYNNGDNSPEVKKVVEMAAELNSAEAFMRSILPKGYEAGESTAGSIPFMIDFIVTSALTGGAGSAEKAASKVGASGVKALATRGILTASGKGTRFLELLTRYGQKAAQGVKGVATAVAEKAPGVTRMAERVVKDAAIKAPLMTVALNTPTVVSDAERRVTPIPYKLEGDLSDISDFIPINDDHILMEKRFMERNRSKALRKAFTSQWIENYSELAGGHFDTYLKALGKLTNFSGTAAGKAIARFNNALSKAPVVGSVRRAANIQGLGGEFAEEIYGGMLNAWLVGDQSVKEVFDAKNMGTTLEALLPTQIAFGILGGGSHALSLAGNQRQLTQINKQLKEEFGDTDDGGNRWEKLTLSEQGKVLDGLTGVYRDAMRRSNEAKDDVTRQNAVKEATYARLLFMRLGLQTRRSVLQGAEAEAKLEQTQEKFNTLKQEAENALKAEANRTTTDRAGNSVTVRYNDKEYSVYNTEGVTIGQDEKGEPRVLGKGTLYLRAPETEEGNAEIIPVPSDQVKVVAVQPKEDVDAAIEQSAKAVAKAAIQPELATQEVASAPMAQEAESTPAVQEAESVPTAQEAKSAPTRQEAKSAPTRQEAESVPTRQEAESAPIAQEAESVPMSQEAESVPMSQEAESAPMSQEAESAPMSQKAESAPTVQETESAPMSQEAESVPIAQEAKSVPAAQEVKNVPMAQEAKSAPQEKEQPEEAKVVSTPEQNDSVTFEKTQNEEETISLPKEEPLEKENYGRTERTTERDSAADSRLGKETRSEGDGTTGDSLHGSGSEHSVDTVQRSTGVHSGRTTDLKETSTSAKTAEGANAPQGNLQDAFVPSAFVLPQTERERLEANIDALILLYEIEAADRKATPKEQEILAKYTGWGGLSNSLFSFLANEKRNATERSQRLSEFIDDKELIGIVRNAETAFYTPGYVCEALWDIAKRLGFKGGNVLEPAMGVGRIIQHMPNSLRKSVSLSGYEKDDFSGRIARLLYPNATIEVDGYENEPLKHSYDLIIANVPFGQNAPYDKKLSRKLMRDLGKAYNLHNFFIAKGFNSLSDGGVAIYITSRHTLDSACNKLRSYAKEKGIDFLGAIRLPSDTFTGTGTAVVSDILVFRKRRDGEEPIDIKYLGLKDLPDSEVVQYNDTPFAVNEYFDTHPQQVLGTYRGERERNNYMPQRVFKGNLTLYAFPDKEPAKELQEAIKRLDLKKGKINSELREHPTEEQPFQEGRLSVVGDEVYRYADGEKSCIIGEGGVAADTFRHKGKKIKSVEAVKAYIGLRDLLLAQVELESKADATDKEIEKHRKLLSDAYNAYTQQYGLVTEHNEIKSILEEDADSYLIFGLENTENTLVQDEKTGKVRLVRELKTRDKSILEQRTCFPTREPDKADNITDAVNISRAYKNGLDVDYIANLLGTDVEHVRRELVAHGYAYEDPTTNEIVDSVEYLSGDVVTKLAEAKENNEQGKYDHNIEALTAVQPERVIYSNIAVSLQSTWIPKEIKENFLREKICEYNVDLYEDPVSGEHRVARFISGEIFSGLPAGVFTKKRYQNEITNFALSARPTSLWKITKDTGVKDNKGNNIRVPDEEAMNAVKVTVERIKQMFVDWLEEKEEHRTKLEDIYNNKFNRQRLPEHPIPKIEYYPNASHEIKLYDHQKKAVSRALSQSTLFAHEVGTGKTFTMVTTAMEMRRLGLAKKPMIVVQNATIGGFVTDARKLYPQAKILAPGKRDMSAENRKRLLGKIATGDYDMVIVPTSFLKLIPDSKEAREDYYNSLKEQFREKIEAAQNNDDRSACRELQKSLRKLMEDEAKATEKAEQTLNKKTDRRTDDILTFDKLNVDALFLDEAHQYKKLGLITNLGQIKGVDTQSSEQAVSAYLKILDVRRKTGGKNVILATGTPVSNTMAEIWTMMRYINPDVLETYGMTSFDDFASTYGEITEDLEYKMDQTFKPVARFKKFVHLNELLTAWRMCADVVRTLDVKELQQGNRIPKLKGGKYTQVVLPKGDALNDAILQIVDAIEENEKQHGDDKLPALNVVAHTLAKQASIDLRLLNPAFPNEQSSKTNAAVQKIYEKYKETDDIKGTQLVFLDIFQSKDPSKGSSSSAYDIFHAGDADTRFNAYEYIRDELVKKGIPRNEIACITDIKDGQTADVKREALFEKVRNGEVRVLLGSTEKMGVGVNVQTRLCALHHLDIVNRPMDFAQRNGRMLRNGNTLAKMGREVEIFVYGTEETLDAASYNRLLSKLNFTAPVMAPLNASVSETEDVSDENALQMTSAELTAALSGSTTAVDLHEAKDKLQRLTTEKKMHDRKRDENSARLRQYTSDIAVLPKLIEDTKAAEQTLLASHPALYSEAQGEGKSHTSAQGWYKDVYIDGKKTKEPLNELTKYIDKIKGSLTRTSKEDNEIRIDNDITIKIGSRSLGEAYIEQITVGSVAVPMNVLSDRNTLSNGQGLITRVYNKLTRDFIRVEAPRLERSLAKKTAFVNGYKDLGAFPKLNELHAVEEQVATLKQKLTEEGKMIEAERARRRAERSELDTPDAPGTTAADVQYRKGKQGKGARPLDAPLETFTPERARDTLAKLRAAKPLEVDVAKARELYDFTTKGVRTWILNTLRNRTFKNEDTGENDIILSRRGADKFVSHGMHKEVRAASASVIPELIYKGIFIGERNAEEDDANYVRYRYYVAGLKVSEEEYTVKIVVGIDENGKQYYDQELTAIEKGRLIDILNQPAEGFTATAGEPIPSTSLVGKDIKLLSLLGDLTQKAGEAWEATSNPQSAEDEVAQHDAYRRALTTQYGEATRDVEADKARKQQVAEDALRKLGLEGVPVEVVSRGDVAEAYARDAMGWHDRKTGKVTIVAENNELEDIEATVLHEVVGHHGLEALLGKEGLATLTHEVLPLIPEAERKRLEDSYGTNEQTIAEEYIAGMAEQYTPPSLWARIAGFIRNALRRIGFRLPLTNGDLLYLTWRGIRATRKEQSSTDTLLHRADEKRVIARCQELDDIQFRKPRKQILSELAADGVDEKGVLKLTEAMNELLEKRVYKLRETWQNDTQSFIELARCVEAATGETIPDEMNIDKVYNQSASKAFARQEETRKKYDRMMQAVRYFARKAQLSPEMTELYFLAKHAPERNAEMRRRAEELFDPTTRTEEQEEILNDYYSKLFPSWNKQNGDAYASEAEAQEAFFDALKEALIHKDYAAEEAITERIATLIKQDKKSPYKAITDEGNLLNAFTEAVEARAGHQDVYHVWQLVNGFNRGTIELWRSSGMIDEATYQKVTGMFAHYVPMQGWKENTNQTPWEYNIRAHIDTNPLKTMHGRQSLPGSPFEAMLKSAMNSIVAATRNEERQALYFFAQRYGSDYLSASSAWYVLRQEGDTKRWVEAYPETVTRKTEKGDAIESTTQETAEAFFARMKELEAKGLARQRTQSTRPETGYLLSERQEKEHIIPLFFDGQKYNVFVNGNPRFSRAATRHNRASDANGAADKLLRSVRWFTREMGQNITGRSLSFGAANMVRDLLFAEMSSSTIYGTRYALAFNRAYFTDVIPLMLGLKKGDTARLYNEYKANGGRTGFAFLTGDKRSARSTRNALSNSLTALAGRAGRSFWNAYMGINEHLEDMSRFAAYAAARKMGLGITEATHRAKSITVNFNKRGTGNSPMYQFLSTLYLFFNANLQGVALTGKMFRDHPKRAAAWSIGLILLQPLMTLLYTALANPDGDDGDDEDETLQEKYDRLPLKDVNPFLRRSNICIPLGEGKLIKVPLSPEMRALNGIGVTLSDMLMGRATSGDVALATIDGALNSSSIGLDASISSLTDANELAERGENGALYTALRGAVPSALQPFGDIAANRDWSGRRIYGESVYHRGTPSYLYADKSTPRWMTNAAAGWNTMLYGQGDKHIGEVSTGLLSVNPSSVNYLAERYLGGILEFVTDINRATDMLTDKNEGSVSQALGQAPVTRRFWKDDPLMQGSEARRNFYSTRRALRQDIERIDRMKRNAINADYKEANEIRNSIRTYLDGRNEMQLRYLAKRFDTLSDTMKAHDEAYAGKDTETRLSVRERDTRAIERLLKEAERLEAVTK